MRSEDAERKKEKSRAGRREREVGGERVREREDTRKFASIKGEKQRVKNARLKQPITFESKYQRELKIINIYYTMTK